MDMEGISIAIFINYFPRTSRALPQLLDGAGHVAGVVHVEDASLVANLHVAALIHRSLWIFRIIYKIIKIIFAYVYVVGELQTSWQFASI
jgi:hypothetical protein